MSKILLFGATGMVGQRVLKEAVSRGHSVTAVARDVSSVEAQDNVTAVSADIQDSDKVAELAAGHDVVVSAFAPGYGNLELLVSATRSLIAGLTKAGVQRLVFVGGAGSLEVAPGLQLVDAPQFPADWKGIALIHRDALDVLKAEGGDLEWTSFSPPAIIEPGERTGVFRLGKDQLISDENGNSRISAEDYAVALVDEIEKPQHIRERFTAGY